jgi:uncharacterized protein
MSETILPFNIMCKPVCGTCNLDCSYCYYTMKPRELYPDETKFKMTDEVLEAYTRQYLEAMPVRCEFGWQGGEPTLAGMDFFQRAVELQREHANENHTISNALQTNGTLLDDRWCEFLAANNFLVGLSLDGPPQWHDSFRRDRAGQPSFHRAWAGVERMRKWGVEFNVLVTLNSVNAPHAGDIYRYFANRGIRYVQFIPILERDEQGRAREFSCTGEQFGRFMLDVFNIWASRDVGRISERFIDNVLHKIIYGKASMCCYSERCANAHVLEFNGDLYACDHFVYPEWKIGNIMERPLSELVTDPRLEEFARLKTEVPSACRDCEFFDFCEAGCPKHHVPIGTDTDRINWFCSGLKMFFREALPELRRMADYIERGEIPPMKAPAAATSEDAARRARFQAGPAPDAPQPMKAQTGRPPGRNDPCPCGSGRKFKRCCGG